MNAARREKSPFSQSALFGFGSLAAAMVASFWFVLTRVARRRPSQVPNRPVTVSDTGALENER